MNSSEDYLSTITLEYLMNRDMYVKYKNEKTPEKKQSYEKDKKFYRKRIYDLTKSLLHNEQPKILLPDVKFVFDNYVNTAIEYFKMLDKSDILQEDYHELMVGDPKSEIQVESLEKREEADKSIMRSIKIQEPNALEKLVKRKSTKSVKPIVLPQQKDINLRDPTLKKKGIKEKVKNEVVQKENIAT